MNRVWSFVLQQCSLACSVGQNKHLIESVLEKLKCSKDIRIYKLRRHKTEGEDGDESLKKVKVNFSSPWNKLSNGL